MVSFHVFVTSSVYHSGSASFVFFNVSDFSFGGERKLMKATLFSDLRYPCKCNRCHSSFLSFSTTQQRLDYGCLKKGSTQLTSFAYFFGLK